MSDLLKAASLWLSGQMKTHASVAVVYRRGDATVDWDAVIGRTEFEIFDNETASLIKVESRDYIGSAAELVIEDVAVLPEAGDRIEETDADGVVRTYEVLPPAPRTPAWRYSDPYHERLRVHTKLVKKVEP